MKRLSPLAAVITALLSCLPAIAQEMGPIKSYGPKGRLFSYGSNSDHYLLTRQSYQTEDSTGYEGELRIVRKHPGSGYEEFRKQYLARCYSYDKDYFVIVHDIGQDAARGESTAITKPEGPPVAAQEMAYNLYWAACDEIFNKFK